MLDTLLPALDEVPRYAQYGRVGRVVGLVIEASGLDVALGEREGTLLAEEIRQE